MSTKLRASILVTCASMFQLALSISSRAQAWVPVKGEGQITWTYQNIYVRDHVDYTGKKFDAGAIQTHSQVISLEYGLTEKIALDADIIHVTSRYLGPITQPPHGPPDTGFYHPTFQDLRVAVRYNVLRKPLVVTPVVGVVIPTHDYETRGHSAVGRNLRELQFGVNVGRDLERILPGTYIEGRYLFAVVERVEKLNLNRSNADWEFGYFAAPRMALRFTGAWQKTYGGINIPIDSNLPHYHDLHDRAARAGFFRLGGGVTVSLTKNVDLQADYSKTMAGINTHAGRGISLGISWRFSRGFNVKF